MGGTKAGELVELRREVERLRAEIAALESHSGASLLRAVAENIPDNLMVLDRDGLIRYINWTVPDLVPHQVLGTHPSAYVPEQFHDSMRACFARVLDSAQPDRYETHYVADDGSVSYWESRVAPIVAAGEVEGLAVISSNVTERREAAADRDRFFSLSLDLFCVATESGYFKRVNEAFSTLLGYTADELTAVPFIDFVHPDDRDSTRARYAKLLEGEPVVDFENRYRGKDGSYRLFEWRAVSAHTLGLVFAVARDVTERRALEHALQQSQKMDAVGQLAGGVAHDFNNLLLAMSMNLDLIRRVTDEAEVHELADQAKQAVTRGTKLTKQLLTFSRFEPLDVQELDVNERLTSLLAMVRSTVRENIAIELRAADDVPRVRADSTQIELVVLNLCINARDAMPSGGRLELTTGARALDEAEARAIGVAPGRYASIAITDNGVGMDRDVRARVFEPFYTTKPQGKGTGLGLSTAYAVIRRHGGVIRVESTPGAGSTFELLLPEATVAPSPAPPPVEVDAPRGTETILVAEDAALVRASVVRWLEGAGYRVLTANDGRAAVDVARAHGDEIHLALLDVIMPRLGGLAAGAEIAALCPHVKLLYTTGHGGAAFDATALSADAVVAKPYAPEQLLWRIRRALDVD